ncbi:MAG TPA: tetratricopeptide repeat protein [Firmicutes bacterium]|nr:tetratricopeptide repeat protein [Bacillota bacterium]
MRNWKLIVILLLSFALLGFWRYNELQQSLINPEHLKNLEDVDAKEILAAFFEETASIETQTIQVQTKVIGAPSDVSQGLRGESLVQLKHPNKARIETKGPIIGSDGTNLWFYWPGDNKCNILTAEELADTAFDPQELYDLNTMLIQLQKEYMFEVVDKGKQWELTGMNLDGMRCSLQVSKKPVRLLSLMLDFSASHKIETSFTYKNENKELPDTLFTPPPTAEILVNDPLPWLLLAESVETQQNIEEAARLMTKAAELAVDTEDADAFLLGQAKYLERLERYEEAQMCYEKAVLCAPVGERKAAAYFYLGMVEFRLGDYQNAIESYHGMLNECPQAIDAWLVYEYLGHSYKQLGEPETAKDCYVKAIEMAPTDKERIRIKYCIEEIDNE